MSPVTPGVNADTEVHTRIEDHIAVITIDRPHARNAISLQTMARLKVALEEVECSDARVLVVRGAGERAFVSGGDLKELAAIRDEAGAAAMATTMRRLLDSLAAFPLPVIAAVNGHARGGGAEVAVAADIRIMAEDATIGFNQTALAIMPAWGGAERLVELVGAAQALALIGTARVLDAAEAQQLKVVEYTAPRERFDAAWHELARSFADLPPELARSLKAVITAARPRVHRDLEADAVRRFARLWVADSHWEAAAAQGTRRRQSGDHS